MKIGVFGANGCIVDQLKSLFHFRVQTTVVDSVGGSGEFWSHSTLIDTFGGAKIPP